MEKLFLDASLMTSKSAAHKYIKEQLDLPDYYGENLDALWDLLSTKSKPMSIYLINEASLYENLGEYGQQLKVVLQEASYENDNIYFAIISKKSPVIFVGHGSPMNAIEDNEFTRGWRNMASSIQKPKAILSISAHWVTNGTKVLNVETPETIHDFYGFPKSLFDIEYKAAGSPELVKKTVKLLHDIATEDDGWGLDHGTWSVLHIMYPDADIPVYQLSIDKNATPQELFDIGKKLKPLREENVLIMGSGDVVHNLGMVDFEMDGGYEWANEFDDFIKEKIISRDFDSIIKYNEFGKAARYSVPTTEHFNPLLYVLGATDENDKVEIYNNKCTAGSLSMTSYIFS